MANVFRAPLLTPPPKKTVLGVDLFPNLLLTTLAVVASLAPFKPVDLPTPMRARAVTQTDIPPNLLTTTLQPAATNPFRQLDWPNPVRARIVQNAESGEISLPLLNAAYGGSAATSELFPNPPGRKYWAPDDAPQNLLATTLKPAAAVSPFHQLDWPLFARPRLVQTADSGEISLPLLNAAYGGSAATAEDFPNPPGRKYWPHVDLPPNLLATTLSAAVPKPFAQTDWTNPTRRPYLQLEQRQAFMVSGITWDSRVLLWDSAAITWDGGAMGALPFLVPDQANPPTRRPYWQIDQVVNPLPGRTSAPLTPFAQFDWLTVSRPRYVLADVGANGTIRQSVAIPAPFSQTDWPTPARARPVPLGESGEISLSLLNANFGGSAATAEDFPNPSGRKYWQPIEQPPNLLATTLKPSATNPFNQLDWPNPVRARIAPQADSVAGTTTRGIPPPPPVLPIDWPNPAARQPTRFDDPPNLLAGTLRPSAGTPFAPVDQSAPQPRRAVLQVDPVPNALILGIPVAVAAPFAQIDWPLFARPRATPPIEYLVNAPILAPLSIGPLTAIQDWPVTYPRRQISVEQPPNLLASTLLAAPAPFAQFDWPLFARQRATPPIDYVANAPMLAPLAVGPLTAIQDWPLIFPRRQIPVEIAPNLAIGLLAQPAPFRLTDWPNPAARRATPQGFEQTARGLYFVPPLVLPFALRDWPNPVRARRGDPSDTVENLAVVIGHPTPPLPAGNSVTPAREMIARESSRLEMSAAAPSRLVGAQSKASRIISKGST